MKKYRQLDFREYLKKLPSSIVFSYLVKEGRPKRKILSSELIEAIQNEFVTRNSLESRFKKLNSNAKMICALTYISGSAGLKVEGLKEYRESLLESFLIYSATDIEGREFYFSFKGMDTLFEETLSQFLYDTLTSNNILEPAPFFRFGCLNDFTMILVLAQKGLLKKKKDGELAQASINEFNNVLHITAEKAIGKNNQESSKNKILLLLSYGMEKDYLSENRESFTTTIAQIKEYLSKPDHECYSDFTVFASAYFGGWSAGIMDAFHDRAGNTWSTTDHLPVSCRDRFDTILEILHYIGKIELRREGTNLAWRPANGSGGLGSTSQYVRILPDFSAVLPQEVPSEDLFHFSLTGSITNLDRVYKGIINRETVNESLSRDVDGEELISCMEKWNAPVNVVETVREWIREFTRVSIMANDIIVTGDEKSTLQVGSFEPLAEIIEPLAAHTVFKIKKGHENEAKDKLLAMGFDPRMPAKGIPQPSSAHDLTRKNAEVELILSSNFKKSATNRSRPMTSGKYSDELKELDQSEMNHVIEYALLMGNSLILDYEGSDGINSGIYTIIPQKVIKDAVLCVRGKESVSGETMEFLIKQIKRIGVKSG